MSNCNIFSNSFFQSITGVDGFSVDIAWLKALIPQNSARNSGLWQPIILKIDNSNTSYGKLLGRPYNIDDYKIPPCECSNVGERVARNNLDKYRFFGTYIGEDPEDGIYCSYCDPLPRPEDASVNECVVGVRWTPKEPDVQPENLTWPINGTPQVFVNKPCCEGGCDTRALTDDLAPKIPYLYSNYHTKFFDFKYHKQFPAITNPGLGKEQFAQYNGEYRDITLENMILSIDWTLEPRIGEIPPPDSVASDTDHINLYSHRKSYKNYLTSNKTCGNFLLVKANASSSGSIADWQVNNYPNLNNLVLDSGVTDVFFQTNDVIPSIDQFSIPYGIKGNTHWNILLGAKTGKVGGLWKWNISSGVIGWYRYYDVDRLDDQRPIPGVDLYISDGDVFFAKNDGPEPLAVHGGNEPCSHKACPMGLKLSDYNNLSTTGTMTIVPSGSEFIYISCNIYEKVVDYMDRLIKFNNNSEYFPSKKYVDLLYEAAILACGPEFDNVTTDLFSYSNQYDQEGIEEFVEIINEYENREAINVDSVNASIDSISLRDSYGRDLATLRSMVDKDMPSYNSINFIKDKEDLIRTLVHKYGCYLWVPKDTKATLEIEKKTNAHIYIDINFDPVIAKQDTFCFTSSNPRRLSCNSILRGNTKIFGYDQKFSIGSASLYTRMLEDTLVYNTICQGDPPVSTKNVVSSVMSVYANQEKIFAQSIGNYQTDFTDIYSRFPSVSSTLDETFQGLDSIEDRYGDVGVYSLIRDGQLRLNRSYRGLAAHAGVDLVAFHKDGGFFYDSTILNKYPGTGTVAFIKNYRHSRSKNNPIVEFETYDVGIKIYDISISKLRDSGNLSCSTLPLDQSCKCWNLDIVENFNYKCNNSTIELKTPNLYTPFLSTNSNTLLAYGGFDEEKVTSLIGDFRPPNHPAAGSPLPLATKVIDINKIFGCKETTSITLSTHVNVIWEMELPDWDLTNANLWVHISDDSPYTSMNGVKAVINDSIVVNPNTQINLGNSLGRNITLKLVNILLNTALSVNDSAPQLYHPNLFTCSNNKTPSSSEGSPEGRIYEDNSIMAGDVMVKFVNITFGRVPFQTKTVFTLPGIKTIGNLAETSFDPNKGLDLTNTDRGSTLILDKEGFFNFDYGARLFTEADPQRNSSHRVFRCDIDKDNLSNFNRCISLLSHSKKPRLYFKINSSWYEYCDHRSFGYYNTAEQTQYHGWPSIFTEHHLTHVEDMQGPIIPAIPKTPLEYVAVVNDQSWKFMSARGRQKYPYSNLFFVRDPDNNKKIIIEGSRAYFRFVSQDSRHLMNEDLIEYPINSYEPSILEKEQVSCEIYTIESAKLKSIILSDNELSDPYSTDQAQPNTVISKSIGMNLLPFYSGSPINRHIKPDKYNNVFTILELSQPVQYRQGYIVADKANDKQLRFSAFATTEAQNQTLFKSLIYPDKFNIKDSFSSKWSDIHYYSSYDILNSQTIENTIDSVYVPSMYSNTLSQLISNNLLFSRYNIDEEGNISNNYTSHWLWLNKSGSFILNVDFDKINLQYYIHRPFSLDTYFDNRYSRSFSRFNLFKNENGVLDINLGSDTSLYDNIDTSNLQAFQDSLWDDKGRGSSGLLCFSGIYRPSYNTPPSGLSTTGLTIFVDLDNRFLLKPVPVVQDQVIYSENFVINDAYNVYEGMRLTTNLDNNSATDCYNVSVPNITTPSLSISTPAIDWQGFVRERTYGEVYSTYPIWCYRDNGRPCDTPRKTPELVDIGNVSVQSTFSNYKYRYKNISEIPSNAEMAISVDAGLYGGLAFGRSIPYISRAVFEDYSPLSPQVTLLGTTECINGVSYPNVEKPLSTWDATYQDQIIANLSENRNIDIWANEIIFRAIYGSNQAINYNDISKHGSSTPITNDKILEYLIYNPDNSLQFLYDIIPMDYNRGATAANLSVDGSVQIYGIPRIGDVVQFYYNNQLFELRISEEDEGIIVECPQIGAKGLLYDRYTSSTSYYLREIDNGNTMMVLSEGTTSTENVIGYCSTASSTSVGGGCQCGGDTHTQPVIPNCEPDYCERGCVSTANDWNPNPIANDWPQLTVPVPCSAFPIKDINSAEHSSPVDQGFARYAITVGWFGNARAVENDGLECGQWSLFLGAGSDCCPASDPEIPGSGDEDGTSDFAVQLLTYPVNSCHYAFTFRAMLQNSLINTASFFYLNNHPIADCPIANTQAYVSSGPFPAYCDCLWEGFDEYPYLDENKFFEECGFNLPYDAPSFLTGEDFPYPIQGPCGFASIGGGVCCEVLCLGGTWGGPQECAQGVGGGFCYFTYETNVTESWQTTSSTSPGQTWEIVEVNTQSPSESYTPDCNRTIATIVFNNYQLRINTGVQKVKNGQIIYNGGNCATIPISSCPNLRVLLPNDSYGAFDYINSNCDSCKPTNNIINIDTTPSFELVTETRYAILGHYVRIPGLTPNVTFGLSCADDQYHSQLYGGYERECNQTFPGVQLGGTAKSNWAYYVPSTLLASNTLEPPEGSECTTAPRLSNMRLIGINSEDSNAETSQAKFDAWKSNMEQYFATKSWCNNFHEFNLDNLIEGVIPGTCSLEFGGGSWPVYGVRSTRTLENGAWVYDSEVSSTSASISVAYISYQYRRPVTIKDKIVEKFVEDVTPSQCATFFGPAPKNAISFNDNPLSDNIKEIYKSTETRNSNCLSAPNCYDSTRGCAPSDLCCGGLYKKGR